MTRLRASDGGGKVPRHRSWAAACDVDSSEYSDDCRRPSFIDADIDRRLQIATLSPNTLMQTNVRTPQWSAALHRDDSTPSCLHQSDDGDVGRGDLPTNVAATTQ